MDIQDGTVSGSNRWLTLEDDLAVLFTQRVQRSSCAGIDTSLSNIPNEFSKQVIDCMISEPRRWDLDNTPTGGELESALGRREY